MKIQITTEQVQAFLNYFAARPYAEAEPFVQFLRSKVKEAERDNDPDDPNDADEDKIAAKQKLKVVDSK